ncbi:mechanosensitive ion channel family protein [Bradyrhizobium sp. RDI18]|uniref:mechanosensitive ion channel family protein n=1 Tax=Bradyrhizobium sp. RDI18 TaxID=3367400 RepID=UPI00371E32D8
MEDLLSKVEQAFDWVPQWLVGLGLVVGAIAVALFVYGIAARIIKRALRMRWPAVTLLLQRVSGPARLALCLVAEALVLPLAPLNDVLREQLRHFFIVAVIALIGWITVRAVDMGAARYLQRFRLDTDENFLARKQVTQVRVFKRVIHILIVIIAVSTALMTFESVKQYGVSLFASAGAAGLIVGLAARPLLSNLIAGVQIAITQPIRIEDAVIIENEWGWIEDIASTYVVVRLWDWRRMVVPLSYFIERPFQNWTRDTQSLIGTITLHVDYCTDVSRIRQRLEQAVRESKLWDGAVVNLQVIEASPRAIELRALVSASSAPQSWDLRCEIREKLLTFIREEMPEAFPRERAMISPRLADFSDTFEHGDKRSSPMAARAHG